jgi:hypothetical protein
MDNQGYAVLQSVMMDEVQVSELVLPYHHVTVFYLCVVFTDHSH